MRWRFRNSHGDTIVEVLIAMLIISAILAGAYATAHRSIVAVESAQERGQALKIAEGQAEGLRSLALSTASTSLPPNIFKEVHLFCLDSSDAIVQQQIIDSGTNQPELVDTLPPVDSDADYLNAGPSTCVQNPQGGGVNYDVAIVRSAQDAQHGYMFTVYVHWDSLGTTTRNEVSLAYRLYPKDQ